MADISQVLAALLAMGQWVFLSVTLILFNTWLMHYGGFPLPLTLCALHMATSFIIAFVFQLVGLVETNLTAAQIVRLVVPTGVLFAAAICTGNEAFLYLTVAFIQMVKAWTPTVVLILSVIAGLERLSLRLVAIVLITSGGVALAIYGELKFALFGFVMVLVSIVLDALRLVLVELLYSSSEVRLSGLSGVLYMSPVCFLAVLPVAFVFEGDRVRNIVDSGVVKPHLVLLNCCCAFMLNVSSLVLVKHTSALTLKVRAQHATSHALWRAERAALAREPRDCLRLHAMADARYAAAVQVVGVFKDWVVIIVSSVVFNSAVQPMQWIGYSVAFIGILMYTHYKYEQYVRSVGAESALDPAELERLRSNSHDGVADAECDKSDADETNVVAHCSLAVLDRFEPARSMLTDRASLQN